MKESSQLGENRRGESINLLSGKDEKRGRNDENM